jgi:CRP/FNR family transcriptional regulator, cyclic AMP receptor protein
MSPLLPVLQATPWGKTLGEAELAAAAADIVEKKVATGGYVCRKGEPVEAWIGVIDGLVKMSSLSPEGKPISFTGVPTGGWFGEGSLLKHPEPRMYDVVAVRESRVAYMPRAAFMRLIDHSIAFNRFLLKQLNERLGQFIGTVENDRLLEPDARVARALAQLFNPLLYPGTAAQLQLSQEEIGLLSGVSRQRANQALQVLEKAGLLKVEYGGVRVLDVAGLRRFT